MSAKLLKNAVVAKFILVVLLGFWIGVGLDIAVGLDSEAFWRVFRAFSGVR
ncbi:MAG TPA: hypothetical protein VIH40_05645 [Xanthobacteraceae bacterium]